MKRYREKKEEDAGFHQCLADGFRNFCLSSLCFSSSSVESRARLQLAVQAWETLSLFPLCDTQLGRSLGCRPWPVHMSPICTPESWSRAYMEGTLTRFSPEPGAAAHLPLQSGASVMQDDSEETDDGRRISSGDRRRFNGGKMALGVVHVSPRWFIFQRINQVAATRVVIKKRNKSWKNFTSILIKLSLSHPGVWESTQDDCFQLMRAGGNPYEAALFLRRRERRED